MVSRATHFRNKARHAQRPFGSVALAPIDNDSWFTEGLAACRTAAGTDTKVELGKFAELMATPTLEAERRLRHLCKIGFLRMSAERDQAGAFLGYAWHIVNPDLPRE